MSPLTSLATTDITDNTVVDTPNSPDAPSVTIEADASLLEEYVGSEEYGDYAPWRDNRYIKSLPNPVDELMEAFGSKLYDTEMPKDAQVYSLLSVLVMAILAQGERLSPAVEKGHPDYNAALETLRLCDYCHRNLKHPVPAIMYELAEGMLKMGHKVGEQIYDRKVIEKGGKKRTLLVDIKTKPHESTAFWVDGYRNVLGLTYVKPGENTIPDAPISTDADGTINKEQKKRVLPRAKFVIPTHKPRNGDPRGTSHLRSIYTNWWKKQMMNPKHMAYVARFAEPSIVANLGKDSQDVVVKNKQGQILSRKSIVAATNEALIKLKGGAAGAFLDTVVSYLEAMSDGKVIFDSLNHEDRQMAKGLLLQTLTTEEGQHMARAASAIHQDVFGLLISFLRSILEWTWRTEVLAPIVRYNFGEEAAMTLVPRISLGDTEVQDIPKLMGAYAQAVNSKLVHRSQFPGIRVQLNMPPADEKQEQADYDAAQQATKDANAAKIAAASALPKTQGDPAPTGNNKPPVAKPAATDKKAA